MTHFQNENSFTDGDTPDIRDFTPSHHEDQTYVSGYGFISEDPRILQKKHLSKTVTAIALTMIGVLVVPIFLLLPITIFCRMVASALQMLSVDVLAANSFVFETKELLLYASALVIPTGFLWKFLKTQDQYRPFQWKSPNKLSYQAIFIAASVMVWVAIMAKPLHLILSKLHVVLLMPNQPFPIHGGAIALYAIRTIVLPIFLEELLFRGLILHALRRYGDAFAVVTSSVLFGLIQCSITGDLGGFVFGLVLGYFVLRTGSIKIAVIIHLCINLFATGLSAAQYYWGEYYSMVEALVFFLVLSVGMIAFISLCKQDTNALALSGKNNLSPTSQKLKICFNNATAVIAIVLWASQVLKNMQFIGG